MKKRASIFQFSVGHMLDIFRCLREIGPVLRTIQATCLAFIKKIDIKAWWRVEKGYFPRLQQENNLQTLFFNIFHRKLQNSRGLFQINQAKDQSMYKHVTETNSASRAQHNF